MSVPSPASMPNRRPVDAVIVDALAELDDAAECELPEVLERLSAASEVLSRVLETSADNVQGAFPGLRR